MYHDQCTMYNVQLAMVVPKGIIFAGMKVYKFGGASVSSIDNIKKVADILKAEQNEKILIVISAIGKTTNALEKVAEAFYEGRTDEALSLFNAVRNTHLDTLK